MAFAAASERFVRYLCGECLEFTRARRKGAAPSGFLRVIVAFVVAGFCFFAFQEISALRALWWQSARSAPSPFGRGLGCSVE
jgi:hypothetical protein